MPLTSNLQSFIKNIKGRNKKYNENALNVYKGSAKKMLETLQEDSPVVSGRYKAGHTLAVHHPSGYVPPKDGDFSSIPEEQLANADVALTELRPEKIIKVFINNNLPYAEKVENGGVNSQPHLVYGKTKTKFSDIIVEESNDKFKGK